ncbi:phosphodiesterase [Dactylosporangium fulvum]|uniref:Phosphodiesterase n=1 Tax=Dactylosporangium fulvum TaxID=53359 RepID=A0ABY5W6G0_9ACTN|nr:phosphodiesterase [Dactylosporangium fulvum]UWP84921.1 phosphodiesterase [Dactylosporangium fulvum]
MALIAHLSDPHITTGPLAAEPAAGLYRALTRVLALEPRPDCVVITGDLADRGEVGEYAAFRQILDHYPIPVHLAAGNHDRREPLLTTLGLSATTHVADHPGFSVVVLDSLAPELADGGRLGAEQLDWLDRTLAERSGVPVFVGLHHPPVRVGIPGMDEIRLVDGDALAGVVARHPNVVRVLAGHLHRVVTAGFAGTTLTVAPSTYRQVDLGMREGRPVGFVDEPAGFLLHWLDGDGAGAVCVTHTVPTSHTAAPVIAY